MPNKLVIRGGGGGEVEGADPDIHVCFDRLISVSFGALGALICRGSWCQQ